VSVAVPELVERGRVTQTRVVSSEWTKFVTLRSTLWSLGVGTLLTIGFPILFAAVTGAHWGQMSPQERADRHPLDIALAGINVAQLAIAVLGVLVITGEYSTGMIRSTLLAVPKRLPVLWAKIGVFAVVAFALTLPAIVVSFYASQAILARHDLLQVSIGAAGVPRTLVGGALYVTGVGVFALAIGAIVRNTAAGIGLFAGIFFVIPPLMNILPTSWNNAISKWLPSEAGRQLFALHRDPTRFAQWPSGAIFLGYCALAIAIAAVLLRRRDA
jgi:ABC-type transport system involved in multi-copper enzyme maturation permease subunit